MTPVSPSGLDAVPHRRVRHGKGQVIYDEGQRSDAMFRVAEGCVRLQVNGEDGDRQVVSFLFPGDLFGFCLEYRNASAEAVTEVVLDRYPLAALLEPSSRAATVALEIINQSNDRFQDLAHHIEKVTHLKARERVIWFFDWILWRHPEAAPAGEIALPMTFKDLADYLSLTPETLSRAIHELQADGRLERKGPRRFVVRSATLIAVRTAG